MKMNIQRLRNLTTGRLHTEILHVYKDVEFFTGEEGVMTHMLPNACRALEPWLREQFPDPRLWDGQFDAAHVGDVEARTMTKDEQAVFWGRFGALRSPLAGKEVIVVEPR